MASQAVLELLIQLKDQASQGIASLGGVLSSLGGVAGGVALGGVAALGAGIVSGIGDARDAAITMAQTESVIRSTGGAAGVTAQQVADYAASLSAASGASLFGDSQIQESANLLLTFTNIKGTVLDAATAISVDMAQALGGAPSDAAIQLGKALNDPIAGISALSRVGVSFTEEQKAQIKTMQEAGDTAGAQAIILAELNKEFGGSAQAAADADGGMAQFNDRMGEIFETVGAMALPALLGLAATLNDQVLPVVEQQLIPAIEQAVAVGQSWAGNIQTIVTFVQSNLTPILSGLIAILLVLAPTIYGAVIPPFIAWATTAGAAALATALAMAPVILAVAAVGIAVGLLVAAWQNDWGGIRTILTAVWNQHLKPIFDQLGVWLTKTLPAGVAVLAGWWNTTLVPAFRTASSFITGTVIPAFQGIVSKFNEVAGKAQELASAVGDRLAGPLRTISDLIRTALVGAISSAESSLGNIARWFNGISSAISGVVGLVQRFIDKLASVVIPPWLQGQSPPPMADWFTYIGEAADKATGILPGFGAGLGGIAVPRAGPLAVSSATGVGSDMVVRLVVDDADAGWLRGLIRAELDGAVKSAGVRRRSR